MDVAIPLLALVPLALLIVLRRRRKRAACSRCA